MNEQRIKLIREFSEAADMGDYETAKKIIDLCYEESSSLYLRLCTLRRAIETKKSVLGKSYDSLVKQIDNRINEKKRDLEYLMKTSVHVIMLQNKQNTQEDK